MFSPFEPFVERLAQCVKLSPADRAALMELPQTGKTYEAGSHISREGDRPTHCSVIAAGFACEHKLVRNGSRQIVAIHMRGDGIAMDSAILGVSHHSIQALSRVDVVQISTAALTSLLAANPTVARAIWVETMIDASIQREWTANVGRRDARTRIAHLLCELGIRQEEAGICPRDQYELPLTQEQLADATGLTAVHVNRVLGNLRADGVIGGRNRHVHVPDWDRLAAIGDFRTNYMRCEMLLPEPV
jgi:CRP-like cAMP-binding protein